MSSLSWGKYHMEQFTSKLFNDVEGSQCMENTLTLDFSQEEERLGAQNRCVHGADAAQGDAWAAALGTLGLDALLAYLRTRQRRCICCSVKETAPVRLGPAAVWRDGDVRSAGAYRSAKELGGHLVVQDVHHSRHRVDSKMERLNPDSPRAERRKPGRRRSKKSLVVVRKRAAAAFLGRHQLASSSARTAEIGCKSWFRPV
ncbi:hypothetical protein DFH06DRAFT_1429251 [Mycena polygramma]|nr:hypothetical protein DFH06DRAFT_1429251 [Mycena polygramma]